MVHKLFQYFHQQDDPYKNTNDLFLELKTKQSFVFVMQKINISNTNHWLLQYVEEKLVDVDLLLLYQEMA